VQYEADSKRIFSDVVIDAALQDYGLAPAFLMGLDLRALCADDEVQIVHAFLEAMNEANPAWMTFVRARGVGDHVEEDARAQIDTFRQGFDRNV
jgi:predicted nucleotidyltransferase